MYYSNILLASLAATSVSATLPLHKRFVEARQTDDPSASFDSPSATSTADAACDAAAEDIESIILGAPTVPDDLNSYAATATDISTADLCTYSWPTSVASDWSSYSSAYSSWLSASASSQLESAASACGTTLDASDLSLCTADAAIDSGSTTDSSAATTTDSSDSSSATTTKSDASGLTTSTSGTATKTSGSSETSKATVTSTAGAVPREVGAMGALFAGVLGAVVAL